MKTMREVRRPVSKTVFEIGPVWSILGEVARHDGGTGGFSSCLRYVPKARTGVVVLSNAVTLSGVADIGIHLLKGRGLLHDAAIKYGRRYEYARMIRLSIAPNGYVIL